MKVILLREVESLGKKGEVVEVKPGYARNRLIPNKIALIHNESNLRVFGEINKSEIIRIEKERKGVIDLKDKLEALSLTIPVQAGEDGKLYGAVTNIDIEEMLNKEGYNIDKREILLADPIKELGVYSVEVQLHPEIKATLKVWVVTK